MANADLEKLRGELDEIDERIVRSLVERMAVSARIGEAKSESAAASRLDPAREAQVVRRLQKITEGKLPPEFVKRVYGEIMSESLRRQTTLKVGYLGPAGTFSHEASLHHFGAAAKHEPMESIGACFASVESGKCDATIVPYENSTEGGVGETLSGLCSTKLIARGETQLRVKQNLIAPAGLELAGVKKVYSHPQSLAQCRGWLAANLPGVDALERASNSAACAAAAKEKNAAAIGPHGAALHYGLEVLVADVEDDPNNVTRFLVLGTEPVEPSGDDKTSLILSVHERAGALFRLLKIFADADVSLSKLESRPAPGEGMGTYLFFIDVPGHRDEQPLRDLLPELEKEAATCVNVGSYPVSPVVS